MRHHLWLAFATAALAAAAMAQPPATFEEAKRRAAQNGRPVLLEFYRDD